MEKKVYSEDEIKKIAPGYRGKAANFDPAKVGKKTAKPPQKPKERSDKPTTVPKPTHVGSTATPQRNESIISDAIFGIDVRVVEIEPRQNFTCNYSKVVDIAGEIYDAYRVDEKQLDRQLAREELGYYATAMLQLKLLDVKAKQGDTVLTSQEKDIRKATYDEVYNIPSPLSIYLNQVGSYVDKMGKETYHNVPALPITVVQNFGGYHAAAIDANNHNLFEEVPSLGIAGDIVMALASNDPEPIPNFRVAVPENSVISENLAGRMGTIGPRRPEIIQRLAGFGITQNAFREYVPNTRFNLKYINSISDIIGKFETFKIEKTTFRNLSHSGGETQVIVSKPTEEGENQSWKNRSVQTESSADSSSGNMGAARVFGFQLYKENGPGEDLGAQTRNWSCVIGQGENPWVMPVAWNANRNARRNLPPGIGTERFRSIADRQDITLENVVRRLIKTQR